MKITRENLNATMEFDHVIQVHADGTVTDAPSSIWAPEVVTHADPCNPHISSRPEHAWSLMDGYSGQYCYSGPIMHPSEFIGGGMADDILSEPGYYVAVVVTDLSDEDGDEDTDAGWAVARILAE